MSNLSKDIELLDFINEKKIDESTINLRNIYFKFAKIMKNAINNCYEKFKNPIYTYSCVELVFNIFWIIYSHTYNPKLTMFLAERAIVLFVEYITLSSDIESNGHINLVDVKLFIYKKTLGPIQLNNKRLVLCNISKIYHYSIMVKNILLKVFELSTTNKYLLTTHEKQDKKEVLNLRELINDHLDYVVELLVEPVFKIVELKSTKTNSVILDDVLNFEHVNDKKQIIEAIVTAQLKLEIYYHIFSNYPNNYHQNCVLFNSMKFEVPIECYKQDIDIFETSYYNKLIQNLDLKIFQKKQ